MNAVLEKPIVITLTPHNAYMAGCVAVGRYVKGLNRPGKHGAALHASIDVHFEGVIGEAALAKHLGVWWDGAMMDFAAKDVGRLQVRSTKHAEGRLLLHEVDADDDVFVLALVGKAPDVTLAGWIKCLAGKQDRYWTEPQPGRGCYAVPQDALMPMETLPA